MNEALYISANKRQGVQVECIAHKMTLNIMGSGITSQRICHTADYMHTKSAAHTRQMHPQATTKRIAL